MNEAVHIPIESCGSELRIVIIHGDKQMTAFMQAADIFEPFKMIGEATGMILTLKPTCTPSRAVDDIRAIHERAGQLVAAVIVPQSPSLSWINPDIRVISDGKKWTRLDHLIDYIYAREGAKE